MAVYGYDLILLGVGFATVLGCLIFAVKQKKQKAHKLQEGI